MTSILDSLLERVENGALRDALINEVERLRKGKEFGLVFERHLPESVRLPDQPIRRGATVEERSGSAGPRWRVVAVDGHEVHLRDAAGDTCTRDIADLVVVRAFGDPVYPGLRSVGRVARGGDKPFHAVLNAENFHALEMLLYPYAGQVDCIYIDPPYNTGARDWKYNNDYVDGNDSYRHSKWLSFMERRLVLARKLLKQTGVLIVTIDENEHHHLVTLLEQVFPDRNFTSVTVQHNPRGVQGDNFSMTHETAVFAVAKGQKAIARRPVGSDDGEVAVAPLRNWGGESDRSDARNCFYPILVRGDSIVGFGDVLPDDQHPRSANEVQPDGTIAVWPIDAKGVEKKWRYARQSVESIRHLLAVKTLKSGPRKGLVDIDKVDADRPFKSVWVGSRYDANKYGTQMVTAMAECEFPFPKSLYAVYDALYAATAEKPDALIVDFFAGSGTTAHAAFLLNANDGGSRRTILVTNNEVADKAAKALKREGHQPGSDVYESQGIFRSVTRPRLEAALTGRSRTAALPPTEYLDSGGRTWADGFDENVEMFEIEYLDPNDVARGRSFAAIAPLLWMKAGGQGERVDHVEAPYSILDGASYAVLFDVSSWRGFIDGVLARPDIVLVFIVTDSLAQFQEIVADLPPTIESVMLYEDYLRNFEINVGIGL